MTVWRLLALILFSCAWLDQGTLCVVHVESLAYPDVAWATQIQGKVQVRVDISAKGEVISASAFSGHPILKTAAEANARKWKFSAGPERQAEILYEFSLEEPKTYDKSETKNLYELPDHVQIISNLRSATH
jgi:TonB family protein